MNVKSVEKEATRATVTLEIAKAELEPSLNKAYLKYRKDITIPGFRKGHAPRMVIEAAYGKHVFFEDAIEDMFPQLYKDYILTQDIKPVGRPSVSSMDIADDDTVTLSVVTDLYPEVKLGDYKGLEVEKAEVEVAESEIDAELDRMANNVARITTVDRPAQEGDTAVIDYEGFRNGIAFQGGKGEDYELKLGSHTFIPGFEDGLIDVIPALTSKESPVTVKATFPKDYGKEELNGKEATFYVVVEYAVQYTLPEFNREFVEKTLKYTAKKDVYTSDAEYLQEYIAYIRQQLESKIADQVSYAKTDALWTYLTGKAVCRNLPQSEIDFYYDSYLSQIKSAYSQYSTYYGENFTKMYPDEAHFSVWYMGLKSAETWKDELKQLSVRLVKKDMITHAIAEKENMETVTDEEYKKVVEYWVQQYSGQMTSAEIVKSMGELYLRQSALADRMSDWLMQHATFTYAEEGN